MTLLSVSNLRVVFGRNIIDLSDAEVDRARAMVEARGMRVLSVTSPLLKCVLPDAAPVDSRIQQDTFASSHTFGDQARLARRAFEIAQRRPSVRQGAWNVKLDGLARAARSRDRQWKDLG